MWESYDDTAFYIIVSVTPLSSVKLPIYHVYFTVVPE